MSWLRRLLRPDPAPGPEPEPDNRTADLVDRLHDEVDRLRDVTHDLQEILRGVVEDAHQRALMESPAPEEHRA